MQFYADPTRASDPHALPDAEVFYIKKGEAHNCGPGDTWPTTGFYWWPCFPGCLPDSDPIGPFATEAEAIADAQEGN
jgi:hypothetical protein